MACDERRTGCTLEGAETSFLMVTLPQRAGRSVGLVGCDRLQLPRNACPNEPRSDQSAEDDVGLDRFADDENTQDGAPGVIGRRCAFRARCAANDIVSGRRY